jgi:hypothetical protein
VASVEEVAALDPPRSWRFHGVGGLPVTGIATGTIEPLDGGALSRVTIALDFEARDRQAAGPAGDPPAGAPATAAQPAGAEDPAGAGAPRIGHTEGFTGAHGCSRVKPRKSRNKFELAKLGAGACSSDACHA